MYINFVQTTKTKNKTKQKTKKQNRKFQYLYYQENGRGFKKKPYSFIFGKQQSRKK